MPLPLTPLFEPENVWDAVTAGLAPGQVDTAFLQASVRRVDGCHQDFEVGTSPSGISIDRYTRLPAYCAGRLPLQLLLMLLLSENDVGWDARCSDLLPEFDGCWVGSLSLDEIVLHRAGLHEFNGIAARYLSHADIDAAMLALSPSTSEPWRYADYAPGHVIGRLVERLDGQPYLAAIDARVGVEPPGVHATFTDLRSGVPYAALGDITLHNLGRRNAAFGWHTSAATLASRTLELARQANRLDALPVNPGSPIAVNAWDAGLERPLALNHFGNTDFLSSGLVGLSGQGGLAFCGLSPDLTTAVSFIVSPALPTAEALGRSARVLESLYPIRR